jgi:hypothetical protein
MIGKEFNINDASTLRKTLYLDSDIGELKNKPECSVTENELKSVLSRYNLREGLIIIGKNSNIIFADRSENKIGRGGYREPNTGVFVTEFNLAYLANILIISGANDYKAKSIGAKENFLGLCNIHSNGLVYPSIVLGEKAKEEGLPPLMVRLYFEQLEYQVNPLLMIARNLVMWRELLKNFTPSKFDPLPEILEAEMGLTIDEYFYISLGIWAAAQETSTFRLQMLTEAKIPQLAAILTPEKVGKLVDSIKADYKTFLEKDAEFNKGVDPMHTKTRFNPLTIYPVIETDRKDLGDPYVVPSTTLLAKRTLGGLYWWFHRYFEDRGRHLDFRTYFGSIFEAYVGIILKKIYGEGKVHPEIIYSKGKFMDWWVERGNKVYLFEAKAYQFSLISRLTGEKDAILKEVRSKIVETVEQTYRRISDVSRYKELAHLKNKILIPIAVFMDIPLVSTNLYDELIKNELERIEKEKGLKGIAQFKLFRLGIDELELFSGAAEKIELEDVFKGYDANPMKGFLSVAQQATGGELRSIYLDEVYKDYWKELEMK